MLVERPYLRDGVDVYVRGSDEIHFVFLASRKRLVLKATPSLIQALAWFDGHSTITELLDRFEQTNGKERLHQFSAFLEYLQQHGIVIEHDWLSSAKLDKHVKETQQRQLNFLLDMLGTPEQVVAVQEKISRANITVFGVGAVGSWLVRLLLGLGFRKFTLVDHDVMDHADVSRQAFFDREAANNGRSKASWVAQDIESEFSGAKVRFIEAPLSTDSCLDELIDKCTDLVINAADEPYIGYTSVLLSRFCIPKKLPLLVAGGFDAHLGSLGEMIIPGHTPCADCYADYFKEALADWVPFPHPVVDRHEGFGGLCSLSVFSASAAAMSVLRLFADDTHDFVGGRGELLFHGYQLERFAVERQPDCQYCSEA